MELEEEEEPPLQVQNLVEQYQEPHSQPLGQKLSSVLVKQNLQQQEK